jgi:hypothetical protein
VHPLMFDRVSAAYGKLDCHRPLMTVTLESALEEEVEVVRYASEKHNVGPMYEWTFGERNEVVVMKPA